MLTNIRFIVQFVLFVAAALVSSSVWAQSSFYLTFERSFSSRENVHLRLDYADRSNPFQVRILRPTNVERFLEGQFAISRSYEEPRAALNPAFFVTKGVNSLESPVRAFQKLLSPEFRNSFGESLSPSLRKPTIKSVVGQARKVIHESPSGFEVVKDFGLDLRRGGSTAGDQWWWFFDEVGDGGGFSVRTVDLGQVPSGLYLVQVIQGDNEAQALLQVSELSVQVKQSSNELLVRAIDRDAKAVSGASVEYRDASGVWNTLPDVTGADGSLLYRMAGELPGKLIIKVRDREGNTAFADTDFLPTKASSQSMFVMTDRPIFRPGDSVSFKGVLRKKSPDQTDSISAPIVPEASVRASMVKPGSAARLAAKNVRYTSLGTISGVVETGELDEPGLYSLVAEVDNEPYAGELRVRDYIKPTFYLEMVERSGLLRPGHTFSYKLRARRYAGGVPAGARYEAFVYRKKYEVPTFVEEAGGALSTGNDYFGSAQSASALTQPQRVYSSIEARTSSIGTGELATWSSAPQFDAKGEASGEISLPPVPAGSDGEGEWTYTVLFRAIDRDGAQSVLSDNFHQTVAEGVLSARFSTSVAAPSEKGTTFTVRATTADGDALANVEGEVKFTLSTFSGQFSSEVVPFTTNAAGYAVLPVSPYSNIGVIDAIAVARGRGGVRWSQESRAERQELLVIAGQGESVRSSKDVLLYTQSTLLNPGEKAKVYAILPDAWGDRNTGTAWRTTAGESVFGSSSVVAEGRSLVFETEAKEQFGTGYFESISVPMPDGKFKDSTLAFRIVPERKRLSIQVTPERDVGEPMKPFHVRAAVKMFDGRPARGVEVSLGVVDRAVYAVQPEFRPGIFDFFFPLPRLNLMTFYSDDLQGYGYADTIRKPNFSLSAIKSQTKLSKRSVRDTAGWFPHLITDDNGDVSATVEMPSNLTEWVVTAVAVGAHGECGEGQGRFRTAVDVEVEPRAPQFIRRGDEVVIPVGIRNQTSREVKLDVDGTIERQGVTESILVEKGVSVPAHDSQSRSVQLSSEGVSDSLLMSFVSTAPEGIRAGGPSEFEVPVRDAEMQSVITGASRDTASVGLSVGQGSSGATLSVIATRGALGVVLSRARDLLTYPYGCAEQLAHSTYPNLVLMEMSQAVPDLELRMADLSRLLRRARENVGSGIQKLLAYQKSDGGFSLWPTDALTSPSVTLMAHEVLSQAADLQIHQASAPLMRSSGWFDTHAGRVRWAPWQLAKLAKYISHTDVTSAQASFVVSVGKKESPTLSDLVYGLALLQHHKEMPWHGFFKKIPNASGVEAHIQKKLTALLGKLALDQVLFQPEEFSSEALGFLPSRSVLLGDTLLVLRQMKDPPAALIKKVERRLLDDLAEGRLWSPLDAALVINALKPALLEDLRAGSESSASPAEVLDAKGNVLGMVQPIAAGYAGTFTASDLVGKDLSEIKIAAPAQDLTLVADLTVATPFKEVSQNAHGVSITRTLLKLVPGGAETLSPEATLSVGDVVVSKLEVKRAQENGWWTNRSPSDWFVIQDGIPSIAEGVDDDRAYLADADLVTPDATWWSEIKETLRFPDRTERVTRLGEGGVMTSYSVWRIAYQGEAVIPPARVFNMYLKGLEGNTASQRVRSSAQ